MALSEDEVLNILRLLNESNFSELHLQTGDLRLMVCKNGTITDFQQRPEPLPPAESENSTTLVSAKTGPEEKTQIKTQPEAPATPGVNITREEGLLIKAPMLGTFYSRPDPGAPPYVEIGTFVEPDDTIGLIEVMKLYNSIKAGVRGRIIKVCVESGQMVEYGQVLFVVSPDQSPDESDTR